MTPVLAFFNNKGGVGKTSLVYHLAWMYADLEATVLAVDLDPQANLTAAFFEEDALEWLWPETRAEERTMADFIRPLLTGVGDIVQSPEVHEIDDRIYLLAGDLELARFEDELSRTWPDCLDRKVRAFRVTSAFWRLIQAGAERAGADFALVDLGPNLGAINRAGMISSDFLVVPLAPDLFSLQGLRNLGPTVREWREGWGERIGKNPSAELALPSGTMEPAGYVVHQHAVRLDRPVKAYERWVRRIPVVYREFVLDEQEAGCEMDFTEDVNCLGLLKHYRSLMPLAQEARKPMFHLKPADGAIGAHQGAVTAAARDYRTLAQTIAERCDLPIPVPPEPAGRVGAEGGDHSSKAGIV